MKGNDIVNKIEFFKDRKVHVSCEGRRFYNGVILEINSEKKFIILIDSKVGGVPILFEEINFIELFRENERENIKEESEGGRNIR